MSIPTGKSISLWNIDFGQNYTKIKQNCLNSNLKQLDIIWLRVLYSTTTYNSARSWTVDHQLFNYSFPEMVKSVGTDCILCIISREEGNGDTSHLVGWKQFQALKCNKGMKHDLT